MTVRELTKMARYVYATLNINENVCVKNLDGKPWSTMVYGLHTLRNDGMRVMWLRFKNRRGKPYTKRFILSILAHELAHIIGCYHTQRFKKAHRQATRLLKTYIRGKI